MTERLVYLAGGITGLSFQEITTWYNYVQSKVPAWLKVLCPLRGKTYLANESQLKDCYTQPLTTAHGITTQSRFDVMRCDAVLANLLNSSHISIGTVMEIAWADMLRKPCIVVMQDENVHNHAMIRDTSIVVRTLDDGIETVAQLLRDGI